MEDVVLEKNSLIFFNFCGLLRTCLGPVEFLQNVFFYVGFIVSILLFAELLYRVAHKPRQWLLRVRKVPCISLGKVATR